MNIEEVKKPSEDAIIIGSDIEEPDPLPDIIIEPKPNTNILITKGSERPEEYKPSGDDSMTEKEEERFNKIVSQLGKKSDENLYKQFPTKKRRKEVKCEPYE